MPSRNKIDVKEIVNITLRLFVVCTLVAAIVSSVYFLTEKKIADNNRAQKIDAISKVFDSEEYDSSLASDFSASDTSVEEIYIIRGKTDRQISGYCVFCSPKGFGGEISLMVAFDSNKVIKSVKVLDMKETPGIGDKILNDKEDEGKKFREQFTGKSAKLTFGSDGIDKIAGSSKSSNAVLNGINDAIYAIETAE